MACVFKAAALRFKYSMYFRSVCICIFENTECTETEPASPVASIISSGHPEGWCRYLHAAALNRPILLPDQKNCYLEM